MRYQLEKIKDDVIGLQPVYTDTGNATVIYLRRGEVADSRGMHAVLASLARTYAIDLAAQRSQLELRLHRQGVMPFYLREGRVFVPLKMRKAVAERDAVYGYVDVRCMGEVEEHGKRSCVLLLQDGRQIEILSNRSTVEQSRVMGRRLLEMLQGEKHTDPEEALMIGAAVHMHRMFRVIEQRLGHIEEMIAEGESKYE